MTIKNYTVTSDDMENVRVLLKVDHSVLTADLATEINNFWSLAHQRVVEETGDVVRSVVRLFGSVALRHILAEGGAEFAEDEHGSQWWTKKVLELEHEGWPSMENLGIFILAASVYAPEYFDCTLEEAS